MKINKFSNSCLVCTLKHAGVTKQIPGLTSLPSLTAKKIHEDKIFDRQNILQFFSGVSKDYKYVKSPNMR